MYFFSFNGLKYLMWCPFLVDIINMYKSLQKGYVKQAISFSNLKLWKETFMIKKILDTIM